MRINKQRLFFAFLVAATLCCPTLSQAQQSQQKVTWSLEPSIEKQALAKVQKVLVIASPELGLVSEFFEDVLAAELMASKISVVSREKRDREQLLKLTELDQADAKEKPKKEVVDLLKVGELTQADALVVVMLIADTIQQNVFDTDGARVTAVQPEISVRACSVSVTEVSSGRLLLAGFVGYDAGTSLVKAAQDVSKGLVQQLRMSE